MYDIFFVDTGRQDQKRWTDLKNKFSRAQKITDVKSLEDIKKKSFTKFFYVVWDNINLTSNFNFDYKIPSWDEEYIHVFKNGNYYDGMCIFSKKTKILQREWDYRFFTNKKEIECQASIPILYDIVFISYHEYFAEERFEKLFSQTQGNKIHRIKDVKGIHQAHIKAAETASTDMFYVIDADAIILDTFRFNYQIPYYDFNAKSTVHVWKSKNPVNGLEYGNGGIKLLPRELTLTMNVSKPDITTSISKWFKCMPEISNINGFNTDPFNTWKSAFRECAKLASKIIDRQEDEETQYRLNVWCNESTDRYALDGACAGKDFGITNKTNLEELKKINDFDWLKEKFLNAR